MQSLWRDAPCGRLAEGRLANGRLVEGRLDEGRLAGPYRSNVPLVLIADDSPTVRKIVEIVLRREGYEVVAVPDGVEALRYVLTALYREMSGPDEGANENLSLPARTPVPLPLAHEQTRLPDLIVLDIQMPRLDGYQFAMSIRERPHLAHIPLVMISRRCGIIDRLKARLAGVRAYVPKPIKEQELVAIVGALIGPAQV